MEEFRFEIIHQSKKSAARVGRIHTPHGIIDTPNFVAVGTNGALKALDNVTAQEIGLQLMFCNTYHLMLHPGTKVVKNAGGLHKFINRKLPIITDSGGFQVFSLAYGGVHSELKSKGQKQGNNAVLKISEDGVLFRSYRDGSPVLLTPETSVQAQKDLGADIIIPFDELLPYHADAASLRKSFERTHRWEKRSLDEHLRNRQSQAMYAVIHGGIDKKLRSESCKILSELDFDGFSIGGSIGKNHEEMFDLLKSVLPQLPPDKPNHLLGIGDTTSLDTCVTLGIDTFDSSHPTKCARHGLLFRRDGHKRILQGAMKENFGPIDPTCTCFTCQHYSCSYLHHLFKAHEPASLTLATIHNLHFMIDTMRRYRESILAGNI